ncbi:GNAT family N-acetyltransferase [Treponema sp. OMZ 840]|uniref:UPF0158 family protein n=1 Tax=Treponema sp. OMZ 840 TaxID=244313 RepID=UPI003D8A2461
MQFELTDEIINQIIFSMEDQSGRYVFDSETNALTAVSCSGQEDSDRYYSLPVWSSVNGFKIMERFVSSLRNPPVKEKLRTVLFTGKGVFRGFKDVLKEYPEVQNLWFVFKQNALKQEIIDWYNTLRDSWGAQEIGYEPEETDELVCTDFVFCECDRTSAEDFMRHVHDCMEDEIKDVYTGELADAFLRLGRTAHFLTDTSDSVLFTAKTNEGDFAGFIRTALFPKNAKKTVLITDFYVFPVWRGLGVGKSLFAFCIEGLKSKGFTHIFALSAHIPDFFEHVLFRSGFRRIPAGFFAGLDTKNTL